MQQDTMVISERTMGVVALSCLTAGVVAGIGARIAMRIVALTSTQPPDFSIAGTLNILFICIVGGFFIGFIMTIFAMLLATSPKFGKYITGPIRRSLIFALIFLVLGLPLFVAINPDDFTLGIPLLDKFLFGTLFVIYALALGLSEKVFDHYLPRKQPSVKTDMPTSNP